MKAHKYLAEMMLVCIAVLGSNTASAQGTLQWATTFEGIPRGDSIGVTYYLEAGMEFRPIGPGQFTRAGGGRAGFAENGTAYLLAGFTDSLSVAALGGQRFGVVSVDLAEFSTLYQTPLVVPVIGYKADGSTVMQQFITDGIIDGTGPLADFQTFYFDSQFADVTRVEFPNPGWSLDNLVFAQVPEPSTLALLCVGSVLLARLRRRAHRPSKL